MADLSSIALDIQMHANLLRIAEMLGVILTYKLTYLVEGKKKGLRWYALPTQSHGVVAIE